MLVLGLGRGRFRVRLLGRELLGRRVLGVEVLRIGEVLGCRFCIRHELFFSLLFGPTYNLFLSCIWNLGMSMYIDNTMGLHYVCIVTAVVTSHKTS